MAEVPTIAEGLVLVEAEIRQPTTNKVTPVFNAENIFIGAHIIETVLGFGQWVINVQTSTRNFVDSLIRDSTKGGTPHIRLRIGYGSAGNSIKWLPWGEYLIRSDASTIVGLGKGAGYMASLTCCDKLFEIHRVNRVQARKGKISDIVKGIADFHGVPAVVEETKYEGIWVQSYISDYEFILNRMIPRAINDKGRGNYKFFFKDGTLHFHTMDYQADVKEFAYYASSGISLRHIDATQSRVDAGSGGVRVVIHDPYSGIRQDIESDPALALKLGNTLPDIAKVKGIQKNVLYHVGSNRISEVSAIGQSIYERTRAGNYRVELSLAKSLFFRAGDIVNLVVNPSQSQTTPTSGMYYVPTVTHNVEKTSLMSTVILERGEYYVNQASHTQLVQQGQNVISAPNSAEGQALNIGDTASSATTKGAGKETSRRLFLDARDPNAAP